MGKTLKGCIRTKELVGVRENWAGGRGCRVTPRPPHRLGVLLGLEPYQHLLSQPPHLPAGSDAAKLDDTKLLRHRCASSEGGSMERRSANIL